MRIEPVSLSVLALLAGCGSADTASPPDALPGDGGDTGAVGDSGSAEAAPPADASGRVTGIAVGEGGLALRTWDDGHTWVAGATGTTATLRRLDARPGGAVIRASGDGVILRTTDRGATWTSEHTDTTDWFSVRFIDDLHGWAVGRRASGGGSVLRTADGGATYVEVPMPAVDARWYSQIAFVDAVNGWISGAAGDGSALVLHTMDGGASWSAQQLGTGLTGLDNIFFVSKTTGWAIELSGGTVLSTKDGGQTWRRGDAAGQYGLFAIDDRTVWVSGELPSLHDSLGVLAVSIDGGVSFTRRDLHTPHDDIVRYGIQAVYFSSQKRGYLCGSYGEFGYTIDGGVSWGVQNLPGFPNLYDILMDL